MTTLTMKEEKRLEIIQRVYRCDLTAEQAAVVLGVSERQCYRIKARVIGFIDMIVIQIVIAERNLTSLGDSQ
jgi:DNA-directed RNA polymerase specialized sigma subunit